MKKRIISVILLILGVCLFIAPFAGGLYTMSVETGWTLGDWLIMYSFVYWPTYIVGILLIIASLILFKLKNSK